ncbi:MAG: hypothetical protein JWM10_3777 [Myxococcaceae bacterium]|nr:hypothetical protein [Myxococcaceae bacterium]
MPPMKTAALLTLPTSAVKFPAACACCDGPVEATEALSVTRGFDFIAFAVTRSVEFELPTCAPCHGRLRSRRAGWWLGVVALCLGAPSAALYALLPLGRDGDSWRSAASMAIVAWFIGGIWWMRNRAAQEFTRRHCPAWIDDARSDLTALTLGFRRASLARVVASLSGLTPDEAVPTEDATYRDPAARVPTAHVPQPPKAFAWWWFVLFGLLLFWVAQYDYRDLTEHERNHWPVRMQAIFLGIYTLFGKLGVVATEVGLGVGSIALGLRVRWADRARATLE